MRRTTEEWVTKVSAHRARFRFRMGSGDRASKSYSFDTREEAEEARRRALAAIERTKATAAALSLEDALSRYRAYKIANGNGEVSAATEIHRVVHFFGRESGTLPKLSPESAAALYERSREGVSAAYSQAAVKAARRFGAWLVRERLWRSNPLLEVEILGGGAKRGEQSKRQLSRDQGRMWLAGALACYELGDPGALVAAVLIVMGPRCSEVASRRVSHLDDGGAILRIPKGKSKSALRDLPVPYPTPDDPEVPDLRAALLTQAKAARAWGRAQDPAILDPPLFPPIAFAAKGNPVKGEHLSRYSARRAVHRVCRAVGLPLVCPHALRGTFASRAVALGVAIREVARDLGQAGPRVTERHYVSAESMDRRAAVMTLEEQRGRVASFVGTAPALPQGDRRWEVDG